MAKKKKKTKQISKQDTLQELILESVSKLSDQDLTKLALSCKGLRTIISKKGETRGQWLSHHREHLGFFQQLVKIIDTSIDQLSESLDISRTLVKNEIIKNVRIKQVSLDISEFLINGPKWSMITTLVNWKQKTEDNSTLLDQTVVYKKRGSPKPKKIILEDPEFDIILTEKKQNGSGLEFFCAFENKSPYPLQNIVISATSDEGEIVYLTGGYGGGGFVEIAGGKVIIPFIPASMDESQLYTITKFVFTVDKTVNLDSNLKLDVVQDFPAKNRLIKQAILLSE